MKRTTIKKAITDALIGVVAWLLAISIIVGVSFMDPAGLHPVYYTIIFPITFIASVAIAVCYDKAASWIGGRS